jgi:hypothetical protein
VTPDPDLFAENARLRAIIGRAHALLDEGDPAGVLEKIARSLPQGFWSWKAEGDNLTAVADTLRLAVQILAEVETPDLCEHGVADGEFCEACNRAYKDAAREHEAGMGEQA